MTIKQIQHGYALEHKETGALLRFHTNGEDGVAFSDELDDSLFIVKTLGEAHRALYYAPSHWINSSSNNPYCPDYIDLNNYQIVQCEVITKAVPCAALPNTLALNKAILYVFNLDESSLKCFGIDYPVRGQTLAGVLINSELFPKEQVSVGDVFYRGGRLGRVVALVDISPDVKAKLDWLNKTNPNNAMYLIVSEPYTLTE